MRGSFLALILATCCGTQAIAQTPWAVPRLPNGKPDLQGTWENNSATPLERPPELAGKPLLSEDELAALKARAAEIFNAEADAVFGDSLYLALLDGERQARSARHLGEQQRHTARAAARARG